MNDGQAFFFPASPRAGDLKSPSSVVGSSKSGDYKSPAPASAGSNSQLPTPTSEPAKQAIRFGLAAIKGVGEVAVQGIITAAYAMDPTDPNWDNHEDMKAFRDWMAKFHPTAHLADLGINDICREGEGSG